ncbi:MAG: DUF484 family protein [Granulosicoccaceae bacterium]|jgi:uncharacterized protein YigA (DUF484 family)
MSSHQEQDLNVGSVSEKDAADYLRKHPDFFEKHIDLLAELRLPHKTGEAVSLIERQVNVLRDNNQKLEQKLKNLIQIARDNDRLNSRTQRLALTLLEASSLDEVYYGLQEALLNDFGADCITLRLFAEPGDKRGLDEIFISRHDSTMQLFEKFFTANKPICGPLAASQAQYLFAERAERISSAALVPICDSECYGLLAIGSEDPRRFHPAMGTVFLSHIGDMVGRCLRHHLH